MNSSKQVVIAHNIFFYSETPNPEEHVYVPKLPPSIKGVYGSVTTNMQHAVLKKTQGVMYQHYLDAFVYNPYRPKNHEHSIK
jgi:arginine/ornithine N-succinyltransferase beta subunit